MATTKTNLGRVSMMPAGTWSSTRAYKRLDVVTYEDQAFLATTNVAAGVKPPGAGWQLMAGKNPDATNITNAVNAAKTATTNANTATSAANTSKANADAATTKANTATTNANAATTKANNAATAATNAATKAASDVANALASLGQPVYILASYNSALPSGARTPCLVVGLDGTIVVEDGKASDEPQEGAGPIGDEGAGGGV